MNLRRLAEALGARLVGDGERVVTGLAPLDEATPGQVSFLSNPKYRAQLEATRAGAVIVAPGVEVGDRSALVLDNPYLGFARAVALLHPETHPDRGVEPGAHVRPGAVVAPGVTVLAGATVDEGSRVGAGSVLYPGVYVGRGAVVGCDCVLYPNVVVRERCVLGDRVILQPGVVIGSDGYGYARDGARQVKIPQVGIVVLEDDVEVGANSTVDRAALGETRIGRGTKIDNLVQIGHNVRVGEDALLVAQSGVSGSTRIGDRTVLAGQVGVVGHIRVGNDCIVGAQSGVPSDLSDGSVVSGSPAFAHRDWIKAQAVLRRLPRLRQRIQAIERRLATVESPEEES